MILYHGSNVAIEQIDLNASRPGKDFDIIYGPIANDKVGAQIRAFKGGNITLEELKKRIEFIKGITYQYFFGTEAAIKTLRKI